MVSLAALSAGLDLLHEIAGTSASTEASCPEESWAALVDKPHQVGALSNLAAGYTELYRQAGDSAALDKAIAAGRAASGAAAGGQPPLSAFVNLATSTGTGSSAVRAVEGRRALVLRYEQALDEIRALPGFAGFLSAPAVAELVAEAFAGPVVLVLSALGYQAAGESAAGDLPRLWWCPAGTLGLLPLHAAQRYDPVRAMDTGMLDYVVPSYAPTIRALRFARSGRVPSAAEVLIVAMPETPRRPPLRHALREARVVASRLADAKVTVLSARQATVADVTAQLKSHSWLHFVGHSLQRPADPGRAALALHDGELTLLDIARLRGAPADFAFLSSCEGGLGSDRLPDESVHLATALQIVGFRNVVAALWSIEDGTAADIADSVYASLAATPGTAPAAGRAAFALHRALREIRASRSPLAWAAYCHTGP